MTSTWVDTLKPEGDTLQFSGAMERAGTYHVRVEHPGFAPWTRSGVAVNEGECSVNTQEQTARLSSPLRMRADRICRPAPRVPYLGLGIVRPTSDTDCPSAVVATATL